MTDPAVVEGDLTGLLQAALFERLSGVAGLPKVVTEAPIGSDDMPVFPFTMLGDDQVTNEGTKTHRLEKHSFAIHVCMQSTTKLIVRRNQEMVRNALEYRSLTIAGASFSPPRQIDFNTPLMEDGATYVGSQIFTTFAQTGDLT